VRFPGPSPECHLPVLETTAGSQAQVAEFMWLQDARSTIGRYGGPHSWHFPPASCMESITPPLACQNHWQPPPASHTTDRPSTLLTLHSAMLGLTVMVFVIYKRNCSYIQNSQKRFCFQLVVAKFSTKRKTKPVCQSWYVNDL